MASIFAVRLGKWRLSAQYVERAKARTSPRASERAVRVACDEPSGWGEEGKERGAGGVISPAPTRHCAAREGIAPPVSNKTYHYPCRTREGIGFGTGRKRKRNGNGKQRATIQYNCTSFLPVPHSSCQPLQRQGGKWRGARDLPPHAQVATLTGVGCTPLHGRVTWTIYRRALAIAGGSLQKRKGGGVAVALQDTVGFLIIPASGNCVQTHAR